MTEKMKEGANAIVRELWYMCTVLMNIIGGQQMKQVVEFLQVSTKIFCSPTN